MAVKLFTPIGANDYQYKEYDCKQIGYNEPINSKYTQVVLAKCYEEQLDEIYILGTEDSFKINDIKSIEQMMQTQVCQQAPCLKRAINKKVIEQNDVWQIINKVCMEDNDEIIFDITNSFRSIPMIFLISLYYGKVTKNNLNLKAIVYAEQIREEGGVTRFQIKDLTQLNLLFEWILGTDAFIKYGEIKDLEILKENTLKMALSRKMSEQDKSIFDNLMESFNEYTKGLKTCRGKSEGANEKSSFWKANNKLRENIKIYKELANNTILPIEELLTRIENEIKEPKNDIQVGMQMVEWSIKRGLIQQAYTGLQETIITYIGMIAAEKGLFTTRSIEKSVINYNDFNDREEIRKIIVSNGKFEQKYSIEIERKQQY